MRKMNPSESSPTILSSCRGPRLSLPNCLIVKPKLCLMVTIYFPLIAEVAERALPQVLFMIYTQGLLCQSENHYQCPKLREQGGN